MNRLLNIAALAVTTVFVLLASLFSATQAFGHSEHISSIPRTGTTLTDVSSVTFTFSEPLKPEYTEMAVSTSNGRAVALNAIQTDPAAMEISASFRDGPLPAGRYVAAYTIVAADGVAVRSRINFNVSADPVVAPPEPTSPDEPQAPVAPGESQAATSPSTPTPSTSASPVVGTPSAATQVLKPEAKDEEPTSPIGMILGITALVVSAGIAAAVFVVRRRRKPAADSK